ncbi:MAG: phage tail protein [Shimia sp.]|nr:phage tail protein [Shimia sp.]
MPVSTAIDASAVARVVGIKTEFKNLRKGGVVSLPQRVAVVGQGTTLSTHSLDPARVTTAAEAGNRFGFGSPLHLAAKQLLPVSGDGVGSIPVTLYPVADAATGVAAAGDITYAGAATEASVYCVRVNNICSSSFVISVGDTVADVSDSITAAINASVDLPIIATDSSTTVDIESKWAGLSANDIFVEVIGSTDAGNSFGITQPVGGLVDPDVDTALDKFGTVWETMVVNCLGVPDAKYRTHGETRWGALVRKPYVAFTGSTETDPAAAIVLPEANKTDRVSVVIPSPGAHDLPLSIAARAVARAAVRANDNPAYDYGAMKLTGMTPGAQGDQWNYAQRDFAVKGGSSTVEVVDGVVELSDTVTFYHPTGEEPPAYRYVVDIVKLQNIIFNLDLIFAGVEWNGAPLIPDEQPTTNAAAKQPKMAAAAVNALLDNLGLEAIISDPETAKKNTLAEIDGANPKRLNVATTVQLSGNTNIVSVDLNFGFYFGNGGL